MTITPDTELTLSCDRQRVIVSPWGASLRRYFLVDPGGGETDLVWGYAGGSLKKGGQGDVLIPFPGRIADGRYSFEGCIYQLERNDKEGPNAIHGFVRTLPWEVLQADGETAEFEVALDAADYAARGYPFSLKIRVTYTLDRNGLSCAFAVQNTGAGPAPVGVGFHPYFTVGTAKIDDAEARIPALGYVEFNERLAPTGAIVDAAGGEWDYRAYRAVGPRRFNHCYVHLERDPQGYSTAALRNPATGRAVEIVMDRSFSAVVVYTGDAIAEAPRRALAIEPMTCASDAFNHPAWGLQRLAPGDTFSGRYTIRSRGA
jgi:aldose 1-epimerase